MLEKNIAKAGIIFLTFLICLSFPFESAAAATAGNGNLKVTDTEIRPSELYARYAVLMDARTGRVLFSKSGDTEAPMASTTKIMTCILALENGKMTDKVKVSSNAAAQPQVRLGMKEGQNFYLKDLLYSLMLESHNDTAVAIAEHIGGNVQGFADLMNEKAEELGCRSTYFITPNGLDAEDDNGIHHTTARDLALIMKYCILESPAKDKFLEITGADSYSFSDCSGKGNYVCTNHNAFLKMMEGALTGKTGFTADAGYCYVGALENSGRIFIVALLACGWPNNKGYKWSDTHSLMTYGIENYFYCEISPEYDRNNSEQTVRIENGYAGGCPESKNSLLDIRAQGEPVKILLRKNESVETEVEMLNDIKAPVSAGQKLGVIRYSVSGIRIAEYPLCAGETIEKRTWKICFSYTANRFLL